MAGGINMTSNHPKMMWPGVKGIWGLAYNQHPAEYPKLYKIETSGKKYEEIVQLRGGTMAPVREEGASTSFTSTSQGYVTRATHVSYALGYIVTYNELKDNLYMEVSKGRAESNAFSMRQTKETVCANLYNRAFNTSYTYGDGKALIVVDHPSSAGAWSNRLTAATALSETALEDLLTLIMQAKTDSGQTASLMPQGLHVPPALWWDANRILKSVDQSNLSGTAGSNNQNVLRATNALPGGINMNHYFTSATAYFVGTNVPQGMLLFNRDAYSLKKDNDFYTDNALAKSFMRFSVTCADPRSIWGNPGA